MSALQHVSSSFGSVYTSLVRLLLQFYDALVASSIFSATASFFSNLLDRPALHLSSHGSVQWLAVGLIVLGLVMWLAGLALLPKLVFLLGSIVGAVILHAVNENLGGKVVLESLLNEWNQLGEFVLLGLAALLSGWIALYLLRESLQKILLVVGIVVVYYGYDAIKSLSDLYAPNWIDRMYDFPVPTIDSETIVPIFAFILFLVLSLIFSLQLVLILLGTGGIIVFLFDSELFLDVASIVLQSGHAMVTHSVFVPVHGSVLFHIALVIIAYFVLSAYMTSFSNFLLAFLTASLGSLLIVQGLRLLNLNLEAIGIFPLHVQEDNGKYLIGIASFFRDCPAIIFWLIPFGLLVQVYYHLVRKDTRDKKITIVHLDKKNN